MRSGRDLLTALMVTGVKVARARFRLSRGTWEPVATMPRERPKWKTHKDKAPMRGTGADQPVVCAGQRLDPEGSSPSAARMRGGLSKDGGNASSAGEHGHGEPYAGTMSETTDTAKGRHLPS